MQRSGSIPSVGVEAAALPEVAGLFEQDGPFLSVVLDTEPDVEKAAQRFAARWDTHRQDLARRGVPAGVLDQVGDQLVGRYATGPAVAVIASAEGDCLTRTGPEPIGRDLAAWDSLPRIAPLLAWHQASPPALLVVVDRTGADLISHGNGTTRLEEVAGEDGPA